MIHFLYLIGFALFAAVVMGAVSAGDTRTKVILGLKTFAQFTLISLALAWVFYFIPW